jgi:predicted aspartyl protease
MAYREYPFIQGKPLIPIIVSNPVTGQELPAIALIDTGADSCMLPGFIATKIGLDLKTGQRFDGLAAGGNKLISWAHQAQISLVHPTNKTLKILTMPACAIHFCEENGMPLLGANNFLRNFNVTILYRLNLVRLADSKR